MAKVAKMDPQLVDHVIDPHTREVMRLLNKHGIEFRIVGGAIRNMLMGKMPRDIDLVVDADPAHIIYILDSANIAQDLGGISHGTVKAVFGSGKAEEKVDISSLGYRIEAHDGHITTQSTHNWAQDAQLRDLTINSMSMDLKGTIYDYTGGYQDLHDGRVRLCANARKGMQSDPTGIMRYFRGIAMFDHPRVSKDDLEFIKTQIPRLAQVADDKKVTMNLVTILASEHRDRTLALMCRLGVGKYVPSVPCIATKDKL